MTQAKPLAVLAAFACVLLTSQAALAEDGFINPDWANSAWYLGAGVGQSHASIDQARLSNSLTANGATLTSFGSDERDTGYKLYAGKQLNRYFALEGGYFDLGTFGFQSTTSGNGALNGQAGFRGVNLDLVGQWPLTERFSLYGRAGVDYARSSAHFSGNRLITAADTDTSERKFNAKAGVGVEYKFTEALAVRGEMERYRVNDAVHNRGDVDLLSINLVYKLGRPAMAAHGPERAVEPAPAPPMVETPPAPPPPASAPVAVSEKVSFAAEALFDFDSSTLKPEGKGALDDLLLKLQGMNTEVMITVGHADSVGTEAYNQKLSLRRADAVKAYLVEKGVDGARVYTEGKGEAQPVADNGTPEGRARNRRVTVEVVGTRDAKR
ncbi:MAG TPA: OmpA family protein [Janthinobacterium sp.]|jgi:OOP family OmpA-OmpF porin|nr:OmpA family protein [Janthinobacterium sp.]